MTEKFIIQRIAEQVEYIENVKLRSNTFKSLDRANLLVESAEQQKKWFEFLLVNNIKETIKIPYREYISLIKDSKILRALESTGVDNWEGYDIAMDNLNEE